MNHPGRPTVQVRKGIVGRLRLAGPSILMTVALTAMMFVLAVPARADDTSFVIKLGSPNPDLSYGYRAIFYAPGPNPIAKMEVEVPGNEITVLSPDPVTGSFDEHLSVPAPKDGSATIACDSYGMMTITVDGAKWPELLAESAGPEDFAQTVQAVFVVAPDKETGTIGCNATPDPYCKIWAPSVEMVIDGMAFTVPVQMSYPVDPCN